MYTALFNILRIYWRENGGFRAWISSPFFHASFLFSILYMLDVISFDWREIARSSLPTILGFSLAAYTITFTLMGSALHRALSIAIDKKSGTSLIQIVNATFFHVIMFQVLALTYSLTSNGDFFWRTLGPKVGFSSVREIILFFIYHGGAFVGCFLTVYAIFLLLSVGVAMFRLGRLSSRADRPSPANSNETVVETGSDVTKTFRFAMVRGLAKLLRLYE